MVKTLFVTWETGGSTLGLGSSPEKRMATHSSISAWRIPWTEEPGGLQSMGVTKSRTRLNTGHFHFSTVQWDIIVESSKR